MPYSVAFECNIQIKKKDDPKICFHNFLKYIKEFHKAKIQIIAKMALRKKMAKKSTSSTQSPVT